jgi:hypothetical protein
MDIVYYGKIAIYMVIIALEIMEKAMYILV